MKGSEGLAVVSGQMMSYMSCSDLASLKARRRIENESGQAEGSDRRVTKTTFHGIYNLSACMIPEVESSARVGITEQAQDGAIPRLLQAPAVSPLLPCLGRGVHEVPTSLRELPALLCEMFLSSWY